MELLQPAFTQIANIKPSYNVGCLLDIPTGEYELGKYGESILNGGLGAVTGIVGLGNNFKSTFLNYQLLTVLSHFSEATANTYDTEINIVESSLKRFWIKIPELIGTDLFLTKRWLITDGNNCLGNLWFEGFKTFIKEKRKIASKLLRDSPFLERDGKTLIKMLVPTISAIDSLTKFRTESVTDMTENELGDAARNTIYMKDGLMKYNLLDELPTLASSANNPILMTAHLGKQIQMDPRAFVTPDLKHLKEGKIMGVSRNFTFLTTNCFECRGTTLLTNDTTKGPEYPRNPEDDMKGDADLNLVTLVNLRSKTGASGFVMQIIISQKDGVLPSLSEFHYIKTNDRFGIDGTLLNYSLDLLPDVKLSRTTVRRKIDENPQLRRALNITSEMYQIKRLWKNVRPELLCTPKQLYEDLKQLGYDWNVLLNTRGWWTFDNDKHSIPFLSTMDLLRMRLNEYKPYWLK